MMRNSVGMAEAMQWKEVPTDSTKNVPATKPIAKQEFNHSFILTLSLLFPICVLFAFGGQPAIIVLCFGAISVYIFDLLGAIEGTVIALGLSFVGIFLCLLYAARNILTESIYFLALLLMMGILLFYAFMIACGNFNALRHEWDHFFNFLETLLFVTIPLIGSIVTTWFLSVELPAIDIDMCFSGTYFIFTLLLAHPRKASATTSTVPSSSLQDQMNQSVFTVNPSLLYLVYAVPVTFSPILHLVVHHNVVFKSNVHMVMLAESMILPVFLMLVCAERQTGYFTNSCDIANWREKLETCRLVSMSFLVFCVQSHPLFDDIKALSTLKPSMVSPAICICGGIAVSIVGLHKFNSKLFRQDSDIDGELMVMKASSRKVVSVLMLSMLVVTLTICGALVGTILNINLAFPILATVFGGAYYLGLWKQIHGSSVLSWLMIAVAALTSGFTFDSFMEKTLNYLTFDFHIDGNDFSIQQVTFVIAILVVVVVFLPALPMAVRQEQAQSVLPGKSSATLRSQSFKSIVFEFGFQIVALSFAVIEICIREQDWRNYSTSVEDVYPSYLFCATSIVLAFTAFHLHSLTFLSASAVWTVWIIETSKLLHLLGLPALSTFVIGSVAYACSAPFVELLWRCAVVDSVGDGIEDLSLIVASTSSFSVFLYFLQGVASILGCYQSDVAHQVFVYLAARDPDSLQLAAICICAFNAFCICMGVVYFKSGTTWRSFHFICGSLCVLIAADAFGPFMVAFDSSSPTFLVISEHPELVQSDHTMFFMVITVALILMGALNVLPLKRAIPRLLFLIMFSYCSAQFLLGWAFPMSLSTTSPTHHALGFPFIYTIASTFVCTSTIIHSSFSAPSSMGGLMFTLSCCLPMIGLAWCMLDSYSTEHYIGIQSVAVIVNSCIAVSSRFAELYKQYRESTAVHDSTQRKTTSKTASSSASASSVGVLAALLGIAWTMSLSALCPHINSDLAVPISCLLLLVTKPGLLSDHTHPLALAAVAACVWWWCSVIHAVFIKGYLDGVDVAPLPGFDHPIYGFIADGDISLHAALQHKTSIWYSVANLVMALIPLPAVVLSFLRRRNESEEMLIVLAFMCAVPVIGGATTSVRGLGLVGAVYAGWRCNDVGATIATSNNLI